MIGMSLALTVMTGVLSTYLFIGSNLARILHLQTLETQSRRAQQYFAQDVRIAQSVTSASASGVTLVLPTTASTMTVTYTYTSGANYSGSLTRTTSAGSSQVLLRYLGTFSFSYHDRLESQVTDFTNKLSSIRKLSFDYTAQTGRSGEGTLTPVMRVASPRLLIRNNSWLN